MKLESLQAALGSAILLLSAQHCSAHGHRHSHSHLNHKHGLLHAVHDAAAAVEEERRIEERAGAGCSPPPDGDIVLVTPGLANKGWAMSPDQPCLSGMYCPIACPPGKVMAQWQPNSTYAYPESMNGGLLCENGVAQKPFPSQPYCVDGTGTITAVNKASGIVSFCQTVLPGNEAMLIPTDVVTSATLAVPGVDYWCATAAHYYVNPPGIPASEGCVWGTEARDIGNWAPYVAGANTDANGNTFVKIAWNPVWQSSPLGKVKPTYGLKIECADGVACNGLPCEIDPAKVAIGGVTSNNAATGAGGADFCVATVPPGAAANIVVFDAGNSAASGGTPNVVGPSSPAAPSASSSDAALSSSSTSASSSSSTPAVPSVLPGIFHENATAVATTSSSGGAAPTAVGDGAPSLETPDGLGGSGAGPSLSSPAAPSATNPNEGARAASAQGGGAAVAGLVIAIVAAAWMY